MKMFGLLGGNTFTATQPQYEASPSTPAILLPPGYEPVIKPKQEPPQISSQTSKYVTYGVLA